MEYLGSFFSGWKKPTKSAAIGRECHECTNFKDKLEAHKDDEVYVINESAIEASPMLEFYKNRSILITGGTGFLGKVLIEKLLRSTEVDKLYILMRDKHDKGAQERLDELCTSKIFRRLIREKPDALSKLIALSGDVVEPNLSISASDLSLLVQDVSVVFHSAATVKFNESLEFALKMNTFATRNILKLCKLLPNFQSLVYVSTAYSNCHLDEVDEVIYPMKTTLDEMAKLLSWLKPSAVEIITPYLMEGRPNTYSFSKALAENVVAEEHGQLPVAIVRPSIVSAAIKEPFPGWVDGANGPTGMLAVTSKGVLRSGYIDVENVVDAVPVDLVINCLMAAAWNTAACKPNLPVVYNFTSGCVNPLLWQMVQDYAIENIYKYPCSQLYRYPEGRFTKYRLWHQTKLVCGHYFPAIFVDLLSPVAGYKPRLMKLYRKIVAELGVLEYFYLREWKFHCKNVIELDYKLSVEDKKVCQLDIKSYDWRDFFEGFTLGVREFILKEEKSTIPAGKIMLRRMYILSKSLDFIGFAILAKVGLTYFDLMPEFVTAITDYVF